MHLRNYILPVILLVCAPAAFAQANSGAPTLESLYAQGQAAQQGGDLKAAIAAYRTLIKHYPRTAAAYNNLGSIYFDAGDYKQAIDTLQAGLRLDRNMATSYAILGSAYLATGDEQRAVAAFKTAIQKNPQDERSEDKLLEALAELKQYPEAAEVLRSKVEKEPKNQDAWRRLGDIYLRMSQEAHARVFEIDPGSAVALDLTGEIQESMGNYQSAQTNYEKAVEMAPDKPGTHEHLGNILWVQGNWSKAEQEFRAELANAPDDCRTQWKLGNSILNEKTNADQAMSFLSQAIGRCPTLMQAHVDRARLLLEAGQVSQVLEDLTTAEHSDPDEAQIHFLLSQAYRAEGRKADASAEMQLFGKLVDRNKHLEDAAGDKTNPK